MIKGLIKRLVESVLRDPYADAFYRDGEQKTPFNDDRPKSQAGTREKVGN